MDRKVIHSVFEQVARKFPSKTAVEEGAAGITYEALNTYANRLAHLLQWLGCKEGKIVQVVMPSSIRLVGAVLSVFKAGGIYLPVDLSFSQKRLQQIFHETFDGIIITSAKTHQALLACAAALGVQIAHLIVVDDANNFILYSNADGTLVPVTIKENDSWKNDPPLIVNGNSSNYIFYTSGSTGDAKAIEGAHAGLSHFIHWEIKEFELDESFRISQLAQYTFDASLRDIFVALIAGGTLCIPAEEQKNDPARLLQWLYESKITLVHCVPSLFRVLSKVLLSQPALSSQVNHLRYLLMAGELLFSKDIMNWRKAAGDAVQLVNLYGPTETTLVKSFYRIGAIPDNPAQIIPAGVPISNTTIAIIKDGRICQTGESGEIYIKTPFATKGYYNNEALTAACFVQNPLVEGQKDLVYRTGDIGRYLPNGNIEVLGRLDNQAKVNGVRVEMGEVERAMLTHEKITGSVVTTYRSDDNLVSLVGYYTGEKLDAEQLRQSLTALLNTQMIPSWFIHMEEFPLNINGKVDKKALPLPVEVIMDAAGFEAPAGEMENRLARIWKELLMLEKIGRNISFFTVGGHSLQAIQLASRIQKEFDVAVKVTDIFTCRTIQDQAVMVTTGLRVKHQHIPRLPEQASYSLSSSQRRIWVLSQFEESNVAYNISGAYVFEGHLDLQGFETALAWLVQRHESLRTAFRDDEQGAISQFILSAAECGFVLDRQDLRNEKDREATVKDLVSSMASAPFSLSAGALVRAGIWQLEDRKWIFAYTMHHIISDYWSMFVLIRELLAFYNSYVTETKNTAEPLRIQYKDYAAWQQRLLGEGLLETSKAYWLSKLSVDLPVLSLPADKPRPAFKTFNGNIVARNLNSHSIQEFKRLTSERGATLFMGLLAVVNTLLYRYTQQEDMVIGSPVAGRNHIDLEDQIGLYLNTLPLRIQCYGNGSFPELLDQVMQITLEAYEHQAFPLDELLNVLNTQRDRSRNFLFDVLIDLHDVTSLSKEQPLKDLQVSMFRENNHVVSKFDLTFMFMESDAGLLLSLEYNTGLFEHETIVRMCTHFEQLLDSIITTPELPLNRLNYLSEWEKHQLVHTFNDVPVNHSGYRSVISLLEAQAALHPERTAVTYGEGKLSYSELNKLSDRLAGYLVNNYNVGANERVGIMVDRSLWMIVGIIGILKSGGAYVPIEADYPAARRAHIIQDAGIAVLLTQTDHLYELDFYKGAVIALDVELEGLEAGGWAKPEATAGQLAYVIYTSGSTGVPKGCGITHGNVSNYIQWANGYYFKEGKAASFGLFTSLSFDLTVTSIFCTLTQGGTLKVYPQHAALLEILQDSFSEASGINSIKLTPSHISLLRHLNLSSTTMIRAIVGGEAVTTEHISVLKAINKTIAIYNEYGPTETTVGCVVAQLEEEAAVVVGQPISNTCVYVLDAEGRLCAAGIPGEICISGAGVGYGYINREELTAEKFTADPFRMDHRMYRTGDLGKWQSNGNLVYLGRLDDQVKVRGYRIELGEIEAVLQRYEGIDGAAVLARPNETGEQELIAYVTASQVVDTAALRGWLNNQLPAYMIPVYYEQLEKWPLTPNGKIDRKKLPEVNRSRFSTGTAYVAPRNELELQLVAIWQEILGKKTISILDNFFDAGGNSIRIVRLSAMTSELLGREISVALLFEYPSIEALVNYLTNDPVVYEQENIDPEELVEDLNKFNIDSDEY
jgi:amino acid adenylation domain-containing protein